MPKTQATPSARAARSKAPPSPSARRRQALGAHPLARAGADALQRDREKGAEQDAARGRDERGVLATAIRRPGAPGARRAPRATPPMKPASGSALADESTLVPDARHGESEDDDDDVDETHAAAQALPFQLVNSVDEGENPALEPCRAARIGARAARSARCTPAAQAADPQPAACRRLVGRLRQSASSSAAAPATSTRRRASPTPGSARTSRQCTASSTPTRRPITPLASFTKRYVDAQTVATATQVVTDEVKPVDTGGGAAAAFSATVDTQAFGQVTGRMEFPLNDDDDLVTGSRTSSSPASTRARSSTARRRRRRGPKILTRDGKILAEGPAAARSSPLGASALAIAGSVGEAVAKAGARALRARLPRGHPGGDERARARLQPAARRPAERPAAGGRRRQGRRREWRILASGKPVAAKPVKTTIDSKAQEAAVDGARIDHTEASPSSTPAPATYSVLPASRSRLRSPRARPSR